MSFSPKLVPISILIFLSLTVALDFTLAPMTKHSSPSAKFFSTVARGQNAFDVESTQLFSGAPGSIAEYNLYIENKGKLTASYKFTATSTKGYYIEVWQDTDQTGSGDIQLVPIQGYTLTLNTGAVATLIVKVTIPENAVSGTIDTATIKAVDLLSGASDSVTITTNVKTSLPYPSNWVQLGSDPTFPSSSERVDVKAVYYANNGTFIFFRTAVANTPNPKAFRYCTYMDTKTGGQQIGSYAYDYMLSSDGLLYEWNGASWNDADQQTNWQIDGTSIMLWTDLNNLTFEMQEIHILSRSTTKDYTFKDEMGPFAILRNNVSETPLIMIPILSFAIYLAVSKSHRKCTARTRESKARRNN